MDTMRSSSFLRVRHILAMSSSSSRKRCSSSRAVSTRAYSRWCRVFTLRIFSRFCVLTCNAEISPGSEQMQQILHAISAPLATHYDHLRLCIFICTAQG